MGQHENYCNYTKIGTISFYLRGIGPAEADGIVNSVDPDQSDLGLHCLPRHVCPKT